MLNQTRLEQTRRELKRLQEAIITWFKMRRERDKHQQYHTQLNVLEAVLTAALGRIEAALDGVPLDSSSGTFYSACRVFDRRIMWVHRVWEYFQDKFDQRDDPLLGPTLAAADEVVWSCYTEVFQNAAKGEPEVKQGPAPLPYIELRHSPHAIPRAEPPPDLRSNIDAPFLQEYLKQLPIPIVGLPTDCAHDPWWLISLGHEVGHHVQYDLLPDWHLVELFGEQLGRTVMAHPATMNDNQVAQRWNGWGREIFADLFSILCMGPWALWAITELELADEQTMCKSKTLYPSPVARLALMQRFIEALGLNSQTMNSVVSALRPKDKIALTVPTVEELIEIPLSAENNQAQGVNTDLSVVPEVAAALAGFSIGTAGPLKQLCGWNKSEFEPYQLVFNLADELLKPLPPQPLRNLRGARLFTSAAVAAWMAVRNEVDETLRRDKMARLAENVVTAIKESRQEGTRAARGYLVETDVERLGEELSRLPLGADLEQ